MENVDLKYKVEDLEQIINRLKASIKKISDMDNSIYTASTFEDGFKHAMNLVNNSLNIHTNGR